MLTIPSLNVDFLRSSDVLAGDQKKNGR